jgi:hypothetical protein
LRNPSRRVTDNRPSARGIPARSSTGASPTSRSISRPARLRNRRSTPGRCPRHGPGRGQARHGTGRRANPSSARAAGPGRARNAGANGVERHRDDRGVMGPVLEGRPRAVVHPAQRGGPVGRTPRPEDQVMGARQRVDAVDLHEAQPLDEVGQRRPFAGPAGASSSAWRCRNSRRACVSFVSSVTLTARAPCDYSYE